MNDNARYHKCAGGMYGFHNNLKHCLASMAHGNTIELKSGHRLVIHEDHQGPGFLCTRTKMDRTEEEVVMQIGSDVAWQYLIEHARSMTKDDSIKMALSYVDVRMPGAYDRKGI